MSKQTAFKIKHDQTARKGLKHPGRFEDFIKFSSDKYQAFDFSRFEFIDEVFLDQKLGGLFKESRADVIFSVQFKNRGKLRILCFCIPNPTLHPSILLLYFVFP